MNILITGANRGIGLEIVRQLLNAGENHRVFAGCRDTEKAETLHTLKGEYGDRLVLVTLDVTYDDSVELAASELADQVDHLDWLINNAAILNPDSLPDIDPDAYLDTYRVNVVGPLLVTRAFLPLLEKAPKGEARIIMISSRAGSIGFAAEVGLIMPSYGASKAALNMASIQLATHLKEKGIGVFMMTPGWVRTDMGGPNADLSVEESVAGMMQVWEKLTFADTGGFFDHEGQRVEW